MKKQLDTDQITNELKGQSLYFEAQSKRLSKKSAQKETNARTGEHTNARTDERPNARTNERPNARTNERLNGRTAERMNDRTDERVNARTDERVNARTGAQKKAPRIIKRHSYQFYVDQVEDMKNLWRSYQARGIEVDLAYFAREAFDEYLTRIKDKANENANARTDERANDRTSERVNTRTDERKKE
jgi:hypothetical protein